MPPFSRDPPCPKRHLEAALADLPWFGFSGLGSAANPLWRSNSNSYQQASLYPKAPQREVWRARIILARSEGKSQQQTAVLLGVNRPVVAKWENRFRRDGIAGLAEARRSGRKPSIAVQTRSEIITEATCPPPGRAQWSSRTMAKARGVSANTVHRLWRANDIKPHIKWTFKISNEKNFEAKFWDVIGLYLDPPERSLVLCCDEKSQCQALERTQPALPLGPAACGLESMTTSAMEPSHYSPL